MLTIKIDGSRSPRLIAHEGGDRIVVGRVSRPNRCAACLRAIDVNDGDRFDGRTALVAVSNWEGSGDWAIAHRECS